MGLWVVFVFHKYPGLPASKIWLPNGRRLNCLEISGKFSEAGFKWQPHGNSVANLLMELRMLEMICTLFHCALLKHWKEFPWKTVTFLVELAPSVQTRSGRFQHTQWQWLVIEWLRNASEQRCARNILKPFFPMDTTLEQMCAGGGVLQCRKSAPQMFRFVKC